MEYRFLLFGILLLLNETATGDRDKFTEDGMNSASRGDLCRHRGGEAHEERRGDLLHPFKSTERDDVFVGE